MSEGKGLDSFETRCLDCGERWVSWAVHREDLFGSACPSCESDHTSVSLMPEWFFGEEERP